MMETPFGSSPAGACHRAGQRPDPLGGPGWMKRALLSVAPGLLRGACHRARIRATRWLAMTGRDNGKLHPVIARSSCDEAIQSFCVRRTEESALRRPCPQKLEERRRKLSSPCFAKRKNGRKWNRCLTDLFLPITERLAKRLNRDFLRGGGESSFVIPRRAIAHRELTAITLDGEAPTQKPAAHFCGRVLGGAIDFDQNTTFHRTS